MLSLTCAPGGSPLRRTRWALLVVVTVVGLFLGREADAQTFPVNLGSAPPTKTWVGVLSSQTPTNTFWVYASQPNALLRVDASSLSPIPFQQLWVWSHNDQQWVGVSGGSRQRHQATVRVNQPGWYWVHVGLTNRSTSTFYRMTVSSYPLILQLPGLPGFNRPIAARDTTGNCDGGGLILGSAVSLDWSESIGGGDTADCFVIHVGRPNIYNPAIHPPWRPVQVQVLGLPPGATVELVDTGTNPRSTQLFSTGDVDTTINLGFHTMYLTVSAPAGATASQYSIHVEYP